MACHAVASAKAGSSVFWIFRVTSRRILRIPSVKDEPQFKSLSPSAPNLLTGGNLTRGACHRTAIYLVRGMGNSDNGFAASPRAFCSGNQLLQQPELGMERVIVTSSNVPTAEDIRPNQCSTYRPADIEKLGVRNAIDLLTNIGGRSAPPQSKSVSVALVASYRTCAVYPLKKLWSLIDGKRVAIGRLGGAP